MIIISLPNHTALLPTLFISTGSKFIPRIPPQPNLTHELSSKYCALAYAVHPAARLSRVMTKSCGLQVPEMEYTSAIISIWRSEERLGATTVWTWTKDAKFG